MNTITNWIKRHQVLTFFLLSYAITWPAFYLVYYAYPGNMNVEALASPTVFSPALVAMLITGICRPKPRHRRSMVGWAVFFLAWLIITLVGVLYFLKVYKSDLEAWIVIINGLFALLPAWIISSVYARNPGVREHFSTLLKPRGPARWYLVIFLIFPGVQLLDIGITRLFGGETYSNLANMGFEAAAIFLTLEFLRGFFQTGGINEESGWRGFALPRLQARYPVIVAVVIVWFFWAAWHLPYDFGRGIPLDQILENRILWNLVFAILLSWVYNRTNGSILAPALLHPAMNTFGNSLGGGAYSQYIFIGLALFAIVYDKMWKKLPADHPAVHASGKTSDPVSACVPTQKKALANAQVAIAKE
jgi:membrane protease YdiL (CAAX protease family)